MNKSDVSEHYREAFDVVGELEKKFGKSVVYIENTEVFFKKFSAEIKRILLKKGIINTINFKLEDLHKLVDRSLFEYHKVDGVSPIGTMLYETDSQFISVYHEFLKWVASDVLGFDFYFQKTPTIRVQAPDDIAVIDSNDLPYPTYHTDLEYGHPPQEINMWWSFTLNKHTGFGITDFQKSRDWYKKFNFNLTDFKKASLSRGKDFNDHGNSICEEVQGGKLLLFESRCIHSTLSRKDETTRISIDARINPVKNFKWIEIEGKPLYKGSGRRKVEFKPGSPGGYHKSSIKNLKLR